MRKIRKNIQKLSKKVLTNREKGSIIYKLSRREQNRKEKNLRFEKNFEKNKKVLKKVLTSERRCDIIVESPRERYREGLRGTANRSLKIEQQKR